MDIKRSGLKITRKREGIIKTERPSTISIRNGLSTIEIEWWNQILNDESKKNELKITNEEREKLWKKCVYLSMKRLPTKRKFLGQQMFMGYKFIENGKGKRMWNLKLH